MGFNVAAIDVVDHKTDLAKQLGADIGINVTKHSDVTAELRKLIDGRVHGMLVTAASPKAFEQALGTVGLGGTLAMKGLPAGSFSIPIFNMVLNGITLSGFIVGTRPDIQ